MPATMGVKIHPSDTLPTIRQRIVRPPCINPIPRTAPTTAWELETGTRGMVGRLRSIRNDCRPRDANRNSTIEWAMTTTQAATGDNGISPPPTVSITRSE